MPRDVLDHILTVTDARPCGKDRWMGHGLCHGSKQHRDLSIRVTGDRILLHDFAGCTVAEIVAALGLELKDLFNDAPLPKGQRLAPKPPKLSRVALAWRYELGGLDLRLRAARIGKAAKALTVALMTDEELDQALDLIAQSYRDIERAELFEQVADNLRAKDFLEREHAQHKRVA